MPSFFSLPLELRYDIYDYALKDSTELTISTVIDTSNTPTLSHIPGVPDSHIPVLRSGFDEDLLSFTHLVPQKWSYSKSIGSMSLGSLPFPVLTPALTHQNSYQNAITPQPGKRVLRSSKVLTARGQMPPPKPNAPESSPYSLLATCRQIRAELGEYLIRRKPEQLTLHVSFPFGLLVLEHIYPALLHTAKIVNICGFHCGEYSKQAALKKLVHNENVPVEAWPNVPNISKKTQILATAALEKCIALLFGDPNYHNPKPRNEGFEELTVRTFYPSASRYPVSICDVDSPWSVVMTAPGDAVFDSWCWKGKGGTAWIVKVKPLPLHQQQQQSEEPVHPLKKFVTTNWPSFIGKEEDWIGLVTGSREAKLLLKERIGGWGV